jgi:hypothetical protein
MRKQQTTITTNRQRTEQTTQPSHDRTRVITLSSHLDGALIVAEYFHHLVADTVSERTEQENEGRELDDER